MIFLPLVQPGSNKCQSRPRLDRPPSSYSQRPTCRSPCMTYVPFLYVTSYIGF
ncbi:hypothetical protein LINGRAHAP2_LOCUS34799 [Linum grandiflorum]